jgi:hypothetical protein
MSCIINKKLELTSYQGITFKHTNLTMLRDEEIYKKIKTDTQREFLLIIFLYNIVCFYCGYCMEFIKYGIYEDICDYGVDNDIYLKIEIDGFKKFIEIEENKNKMIKGISTYRSHRVIPYNSDFMKIFNFYDTNFNSKIILENLCDIEISNDQYYSIIIYYLDKFFFLRDIFEPMHNARSLIIKNYYKDYNPMAPNIDTKNNLLPLKDSNGDNYELIIPGSDVFFYIFDEKFKNDIINKTFNDGYNFYWEDKDDKNSERRLKNNCVKYLVEILDPYNNQIISMTLTRIPQIQNIQIHFYIKKNIITQIKNFISNTI